LASKDGIDGVGIKLFKARANLPQREIYMFFSILQQSPKSFAGLIRMQNWRFAHFFNGDSLISCAPHKK
jgi:hypothetical protein